MAQLILRFVVGGIAVAVFAVAGDLLKPKRFAGIFGAAPAVALSSLALTFMDKGAQDAVVMGRSMMAGAVGFFVYCLAVSLAMDHLELPGWLVAGVGWLIWLAVALGLWVAFLR